MYALNHKMFTFLRLNNTTIMARKSKLNLDYFPHIISSGKKISFIRKKWGNDGYACWFTMLEDLGLADHHYLDLRNDEGEDYSIQMMYLSERCYIPEEKLISIINDLVKLDSFDKEFWKHKILWSKEFHDSVQDAWKRRDTDCLTREQLITLLIEKKDKVEEVKKTKIKKEKIVKEKIPESVPNQIIVKEITYPWDSENFKNSWSHWKEFKKEQYKFTYKPIGEQSALIDLSKCSKGIEEVAIIIIHTSIAKGWKGFFPLKEDKNGESNSEKGNGKFSTISDSYAERVLGDLLSE
jgi:hypothetical protein